MKPGDFVKVLGTDSAEWYAEVVGTSGTSGTDALEVFFIEKKGNVWSYAADWQEIPLASVQEHIKTAEVGIITALEQLGFRPIDEGTFVKLSEEDAGAVVPVGMQLPTEDDPIGIHPEMRDFIVPDEEGEAFSFAEPTSQFVIEMHEAVHQYNEWAPTEPQAAGIKQFIDNMDTRECIQEDNRNLNQTALSYTRPPLPTVT